MTRASRQGFTLVEVIVALLIMGGVLLGMGEFTRRFTRATTDSAVIARASDLAVIQLETIKGWRHYSTLVSTYHGTVATFASSSQWGGLRRETLAVRTGPTTTADHVTVTVVVTGGGLPAPVRKSTIISAF